MYRLYFINACMALPFAFVVSYLSVHVLVKKHYSNGERLKFWAFQIALTLVLLLLRRFVNYYLIYPRYFPQARELAFFSIGKWIIDLVNLYLIAGVYALFYFVRSWYEERERAQSLLQGKTLAELELLKSQVQPHFIFNALNNIYSTALRTHPETAKLIAHLSSFLNYSLYEAKHTFVPLNSELAFVKHYIEIQKNRYGSKPDVALNIYDQIDGLYIAPMLLLPLIENSFKHGIADSIGGGWIRVDVSRQQGYFSVKIENSVEEKFKSNETATGGIGISNVQKRLQLVYPGGHEFKIAKEPYSHLVILKIKVSK